MDHAAIGLLGIIPVASVVWCGISVREVREVGLVTSDTVLKFGESHC